MKFFGLVLVLWASACGVDAPGTTVNNGVYKVDSGNDRGPDVDMNDASDDHDLDLGSQDTGTDQGKTPDKCDANTDCKQGEVCKFDLQSGDSFCVEKQGNDNGATCTLGNECTSGICINGSCADLCKGESDCPAGYGCTKENVKTALNDEIKISVCTKESVPCLASADCPAGKVCSFTGSGKLECQDAAGTGKVGDACTLDANCASNLCLDNLCSALCERPSDCSADGSFICESRKITVGGKVIDANLCVPKPASQCLSDSDCTNPQRCVATRSQTDIEFACGNANAGGKDSGEVCANDSECSQNLCVNNVCAGPCQGNGDCSVSPDATCDLVNVDLGNGNTDSVQICTPPVTCVEKADCRINETCYIRDDQTKTDLFCRAPNVGAGSLGQVCSIPLECASNYCLNTRFRNVCSEACNDNADCNVPGYSCQDFAFDNGSNAKICQPSTPPSCQSNNDCVAGTICSFVENAAGNGVETLCVPSTGGDAAGVACQNNNDCASLICLSGFCSAPCSDATQCTSQQLCQNEVVNVGNNSTTLKVCKTPPVTPCADSSDCTDGIRVCSVINDAMGNLAGFCAFPNPNGGQMGDACTTGNDCRENVCLTNISNSCSVVCNDNTDCTAGMGCTTYGNIGFCNDVCADNSDCTTGQLCTINSDTISNDIDLVCQVPITNGADLGASCTTGGDCAAGLCLTTTAFNQTTCTADANCAMGETCECPIDQPNCMAGKRCATKEKLCTNLCNDNADCGSGVMGNTLTECSSNTVVQLPNGQGTKTIATCARP